MRYVNRAGLRLLMQGERSDTRKAPKLATVSLADDFVNGVPALAAFDSASAGCVIHLKDVGRWPRRVPEID